MEGDLNKFCKNVLDMRDRLGEGLSNVLYNLHLRQIVIVNVRVQLLEKLDGE